MTWILTNDGENEYETLESKEAAAKRFKEYTNMLLDPQKHTMIQMAVGSTEAPVKGNIMGGDVSKHVFAKKHSVGQANSL